ncbi:hypothetical protein EV182_006180, partial [Spiromyces aspiralis]
PTRNSTGDAPTENSHGPKHAPDSDPDQAVAPHPKERSYAEVARSPAQAPPTAPLAKKVKKRHPQAKPAPPPRLCIRTTSVDPRCLTAVMAAVKQADVKPLGFWQEDDRVAVYLHSMRDVQRLTRVPVKTGDTTLHWGLDNGQFAHA